MKRIKTTAKMKMEMGMGKVMGKQRGRPRRAMGQARGKENLYPLSQAADREDVSTILQG
jgi:hypothetical protein